MKRISGILLGVALAATACGGESARGEACDEEGVTEGECEAGDICGMPDDGSGPICLKICTEQAECASNESCNGVSGTDIKGCRPK